MRDNMPNYLNMHNIDPSRIEPARIDTPPGNDSIRPGQSKVVKMTREEAANILDLKTRPEALADFVGPELAGIVHQAIIMGAEALRSRWVKTADRLPTKDDVDSRMNVMAWHIWYGAEIVDYGLLLDDPAMYIWWAPIPTPTEEVCR